MIAVRTIVLRAVATIEIVIFMVYLIGGPRGVRSLRILRQQNNELQTRMHSLEEEIQTMHEQAQDWTAYPYYQEQYAREHLQMARKDDEVYLL